jgi:hypothetical protein
MSHAKIGELIRAQPIQSNQKTSSSCESGFGGSGTKAISHINYPNRDRTQRGTVNLAEEDQERYEKDYPIDLLKKIRSEGYNGQKVKNAQAFGPNELKAKK